MSRVEPLIWKCLRWQQAMTAKPARRGSQCPRGSARRLRFAACIGLLLGLPLHAVAGAQVRPELRAAGPVLPVSTPVSAPMAGLSGGRIAAGQGQITQSAHTTTITQHSQVLSLAWQTFDIGAQDTVNFLQPDAQAIAVNRIADPNGSVILGHLNANGQVWLVNPNGILFGQGAQVNVGGLVASTLDVDSAGRGAGMQRFSGAGTGSIVNRGTLAASEGGYVALIGAQVSNQGVIHAPGGTVALGAGSTVDLQFDGNRLLSMQVQKSELDALAENRQLIRADGGRVLMTAGAQDSLLASVVNNTGVIQARTVAERNGQIVLLGGAESGTVNVGGTLDAGAPDGGDGGFIETSAAHVHVADDAIVRTPAPQGRSGTWLIDPQDFIIAADQTGTITSGTPSGDVSGATLGTALASGNVTIESHQGSGAGSGNIEINDAVSWSSHTLTLTASNDININAVMTAGGSAGLALNPATANGSDAAVATGTVNAMPGTGRVDFTGSGNTLSIGGTPYTIITRLGATGSTSKTDLQGMNGDLAGHYALGADIDASATATWSPDGSGGYAGFAPIGNGTTSTTGSGFSGVFDGLGHTISGLIINSNLNAAGLFQYINGGTLRNVGSTGGASTDTADGARVGGLVGYSFNGMLTNAHATGTVTGGSGASIGGLVGYNENGAITNAHASGTVTGHDSFRLAGLIGWNNGSVTNAYATGDVMEIGSVDVRPYVAGLVGQNYGYLTNTYATGAVTSPTTFARIGGLVGTNFGVVTNAYATGAVTGGPNAWVGGLAGASSGGGFINVYATGAVTGKSNDVGGLIGNNLAAAPHVSTVVNGYWDIETSGQLKGIGVDSNNQVTIGLSTRALIQSLPAGFATDAWGNGDNQTTPYLLNLAGNQVFNVNDLPAGAITASSRPNLYSVVQNVDQLQAVSSTLSGRYVLGNDIDARATLNWNSGAGFAPLGNDSTAFGGVFDGLRHTIDGITIQRSSEDYVGLFGYNTGTVRNVGLVGGSIKGTAVDAYVGAMVGYNIGGTLANTYSTGAVTGGAGARVGGLVGRSYGGMLSNAYATGAVAGGDGAAVGGLIGINYSPLVSGYATGSVTGGIGGWVGGLVGQNGGVITSAYATGATNGDRADIGGLAGRNGANGVITHGYWDTETTGQSAGIGTDKNSQTITGLTTRALIQSLPAGFATDAWGNGDNQTTPYLLGLAGNQVFNVNDLPAGAITASNRPSLYSVIQNVDQLQAVSNALSGRYVLGNDIDASATATWNPDGSGGYAGFVPIGDGTASSFGTSFNGVFDGLGHRIDGLFINSNLKAAGLFQYVTSGTLRNLGLAGGAVMDAASGARVGSLIGYSLNSTVSNAFATGSATGGDKAYVGGLVGYTSGGTIIRAHASGAVTGGGDVSYAGGLIGFNSTGTITDVYATGAVAGGSTARVGGLIGWTDGSLDTAYATGTTTSGQGSYAGGVAGANYGQMTHAFATGSVTVGDGGSTAGGLVGYNSGGTINDAYATGSVAGGDGARAGGLIGQNLNGGTVANAYASGIVSGGDGGANVGGLVGSNNSGGEISHSYATNSASGGSAARVGGLVGVNYGVISNAYASGSATAAGDLAQVGGLVGVNGSGGTITDAHASGNVSGGDGISYAGGLIGYNNLGLVRNVYASGAVSGGDAARVGGLIGWTNGSVTTAYATGAATGGVSSFVGGLAGVNYGPITDTYATGAVTAGNNGPSVGGLIGYNSGGTITNAYALGAVTGGSGAQAGGLVGYNFNGGTIIHGYWDAETSGQSIGIGVDKNNQTAIGLTRRGWLTDGPIARGVFDNATWVAGYLYPALKALPYVLVTGTGSQTYGSSGPLIMDISSVDQDGNPADGLVDASSLAWLSSATTTSRAGTIAVLGGQGAAVAPGYQLTYAGSLTVDPKNLNLNALQADNKVYDATTTASVQASLDGVINGDQVDAALSAHFDDKNVGTAKTVTVDSITLNGADAGNYVIAKGQTTTADVTPATLALTGLAASNKVYDTTTNAAASASLSGVLGSDAVDAVLSARFADKNVGTAKTVTVDGVTLSGADAGNYVIAKGQTTTADITPATLALDNLAAANKVYDATINAVASAGLSGVLGSDAVDGELMARFTDKNVGTAKLVTIDGITLDGADAGNYVIAKGQTTTADITPATLRLTHLAAANKVYDTTINARARANLSGVLGSDAVDVAFSARFADKNVGTAKTVTVDGITLNGADAGNYVIAKGQTTTANITPATLALDHLAAPNKIYDATTNAAASASLSGVLGGDAVDAVLSARFADKNVGTAKTVTVDGITLSGADAGNYVIAKGQTTTADITPATLALDNLAAANKVYDATTSATASGSLSGVLGGDDVDADLTAHFADKNVGTGKTVTVDGITLGGGDASNYVIAKGQTTTADISPAILVYVAKTHALWVGQTPRGLEGTVHGLLGDDTLANATHGTLSWWTRADTGAIGHYAINGGGLTALNYVFTQAPDNATALAVMPAILPSSVVAQAAQLQKALMPSHPLDAPARALHVRYTGVSCNQVVVHGGSMGSDCSAKPSAGASW